MPRKAKLLLILVFVVHAVGLWLWTLGKRGADADPASSHSGALSGEAGWRPARRSDRWTCIVLHHSASDEGNAARFDAYHKTRGWDELGYHFVIGNGSASRDGQVEVGPRWRSQKHGAHTKSAGEYYNQHGIGICLVGNFDNGRPGERQMRSLLRLVRFLCREFGIAPSHVLTHGGVTGETRCPGKHFDVEAVRRAVEADQESGVAVSK